MRESLPQRQAVEIFGREAGRLTAALQSLREPDWDRPTGCVPWRVRELLGHVRVVIAWLPGMLSSGRPAGAEVSAVQYYRPDERFSAATNAARISLAQDCADAHATGASLLDDFAQTWRQAYDLCLIEPDQRVVRTRHGDAMLLSEFLLTRVVELAVHGLDLAAALDRQPWLTHEAADAVERLLLGHTDSDSVRALGWDQVTFLRKATGREPISEAERTRITEAGIHWLTLG
jgi:uncharacterized protein (TIGR03083 family)